METAPEQSTTQQDTQEAIQVNPPPTLQAWSAIDEKGECKEVSKEESSDSDKVEESDNVEENQKEVKNVDKSVESTETEESTESTESEESEESDDSDMCCEEDCDCIVHLECPHCLVTLGLKMELSTFRCLVCGMTIELDSESESESDEEEEEEKKEETSTVPSFIVTAVKFLLYAYIVKFLLYIIDGGNTFQHTCHCVCEGGKFMSLP